MSEEFRRYANGRRNINAATARLGPAGGAGRRTGDGKRAARFRYDTPQFSPRQRELLTLMAQGFVLRAQLAAKLNVTESTVRSIVQRIREKVDIPSTRTGLIEFAREWFTREGGSCYANPREHQDEAAPGPLDERHLPGDHADHDRHHGDPVEEG